MIPATARTLRFVFATNFIIINKQIDLITLKTNKLYIICSMYFYFSFKVFCNIKSIQVNIKVDKPYL